MSAAGFTRVPYTAEEEAEYRAKHHGHAPAVYRVKCDACKKRMWGSGIAIGSHRRACKGGAS
jgi:hypothetical protein